MVERDVSYCGMHVITQFQAGEGIAELEADTDFVTLFGETERRAFLDFTQRLQGSWTQEDLDFARSANDRRMEWMQQFHALGGLLVGTDMQFGGIMLHRELGNLNSPLKKASLTGFHATAKHIVAKAVSPSSETMRTI